jgi:hypothetical protein
MPRLKRRAVRQRARDRLGGRARHAHDAQATAPWRGRDRDDRVIQRELAHGKAGEWNEAVPPANPLPDFAGDDDALQKRVAHTVSLERVVFGHRQVHDAPRVRVERADLLWRAVLADPIH